MTIRHNYDPDISICDAEEGHAVMIVEVEPHFPNHSQTEAKVMLRTYMSRFSTKIGLFVTPQETLIMRQAYMDRENKAEEGYYIEFVDTTELFGDMSAGSDVAFQKLVYASMMELVDDVKRYASTKLVKTIAAELEFFLENVVVWRRKV